MAICISDDLGVDGNGRLIVKPGGGGTDVNWPYACSESANNALHRDVGGGLWVAPPTLLGKLRTTGTLVHAPSAVPVANTTVVSAVLNMPNPSTCHTADVILWVTVQVDFVLNTGGGRAAFRVNGDELWRLQNGAPATGSAIQYQPQGVKVISTGLAQIAPGGSQLYTIPIDVGAGLAGSTYANIRWSVDALAWANAT